MDLSMVMVQKRMESKNRMVCGCASLEMTSIYYVLRFSRPRLRLSCPLTFAFSLFLFLLRLLTEEVGRVEEERKLGLAGPRFSRRLDVAQ